MNPLCEEFREVREEFIKAVDSVPKNRRNEVFLGEWNLKDMLAHLTGWGLHQTEVLRAFKRGAVAERPESVKDFNDKSVEARRKLTWSEVYDEFVKTGEQLLAEYDTLTDDQWKKKIWPDKELTPAEFIKIEIKHYRETHLPQIRKWLLN